MQLPNSVTLPAEFSRSQKAFLCWDARGRCLYSEVLSAISLVCGPLATICPFNANPGTTTKIVCVSIQETSFSSSLVSGAFTVRRKHVVLASRGVGQDKGFDSPFIRFGFHILFESQAPFVRYYGFIKGDILFQITSKLALSCRACNDEYCNRSTMFSFSIRRMKPTVPCCSSPPSICLASDARQFGFPLYGNVRFQGTICL